MKVKLNKQNMIFLLAMGLIILDLTSPLYVSKVQWSEEVGYFSIPRWLRVSLALSLVAILLLLQYRDWLLKRIEQVKYIIKLKRVSSILYSALIVFMLLFFILSALQLIGLLKTPNLQMTDLLRSQIISFMSFVLFFLYFS